MLFLTEGTEHIESKKLHTLGSSPKCANWASVSIERNVLIMSLHFFGVSSTLPARNKQQAAVT